MHKWETNPNTPELAAMRAVMELLNRSGQAEDSEEEAVRRLIGQMLVLTNCFAQLSLLLDKVALSNSGTQPMEEAMLSVLLETANPITSTCDQLKASLTSSTQSQWILRNRRVLFHGCVAMQDFVDEGLDYHRIG